MHGQFSAPISYAGIISIAISAGLVVSSLLSDSMARRFGTGLVVILSVFISGISLIGFSVSGSFLLLCLWAIPYGLAAGSMDAVINNYVAVNYSSGHMHWLHCLWGLGAMIGPYIMGFYLTHGFEWTAGYITVALIQIVFFGALFISLPWWKKPEKDEKKDAPIKPFSELIKIKGVKYVLLAFVAYCAIEATARLWTSTYLVVHRGISTEAAAGFSALLFIGITVGRLISGIISAKMGNQRMIMAGISLIFVGVGLLWLPVQADLVSLIGLVIIGLGCAPVFPAIIHSTPEAFGHENSQALVGMQLASAYTGSALMPTLFGLIAGNVGMGVYPLFLLGFGVMLLVMVVIARRSIKIYRLP